MAIDFKSTVFTNFTKRAINHFLPQVCKKNYKMFLRHINELKSRFFYLSLNLLISFSTYYYYSEEILHFLVSPLGTNKHLIFTNITEAFFSYISLAIYGSLLFLSLHFLYHFISFLHPGLYNKEKQRVQLYSFVFLFFFFLCNILTYSTIIPSAWKFLLAFETTDLNGFFNIHLEAKINEYLETLILIFILSNLFFQLPTIMILLLNFEILSTIKLIRYRKVFYIISLILAAFCSPPDILSQLLLALPILLFYETLTFLLIIQTQYEYNIKR
jgi:sec-independent protein translocase protein TatC